MRCNMSSESQVDDDCRTERYQRSHEEEFGAKQLDEPRAGVKRRWCLQNRDRRSNGDSESSKARSKLRHLLTVGNAQLQPLNRRAELGSDFVHVSQRARIIR